MTTNQIEQYADIGGISSPDLNLKVLLRREVCPMFMHDVGYTSWRRITFPFSTVIGSGGKEIALPSDVENVSYVGVPATSDKGLQYIGEDPEKLSKAEANAVNAAPTGYYLAADATTGIQNKLRFNCPPDAVYASMLIYYRTTFFADDTTDVEMSKFVPAHFQEALIEGLRMKICYFRFGIGDPRYVAAEASYGKVVERAADNKEQARRNFAVFAR